ncbi:MAG: hypothetical protein ABW034_25070 [Steroidobacteraceae bacterium]
MSEVPIGVPMPPICDANVSGIRTRASLAIINAQMAMSASLPKPAKNAMGSSTPSGAVNGKMEKPIAIKLRMRRLEVSIGNLSREKRKSPTTVSASTATA